MTVTKLTKEDPVFATAITVGTAVINTASDRVTKKYQKTRAIASAELATLIVTELRKHKALPGAST